MIALWGVLGPLYFWFLVIGFVVVLLVIMIYEWYHHRLPDFFFTLISGVILCWLACKVLGFLWHVFLTFR